ncbi:MAG: Hsp20/alpha crystallin family protein [Rhodospirillales bacterium]|nr:Hsp20/alpha crystallin family protein [Rhodospirillales bacterium]
MAEASKVPARTGQASGMPQVWQPFESLRHEIGRLFDDFGFAPWRTPFRRSLADFQRATAPPVDIVETDKAYEVTADVPGFDEKDIEVKLLNGTLYIKGERKSEKEEKKEGFYLSEREFGSFERRFELPDEVDADKIAATLKKGVLTVTLPKKPEAQKPAKKIEVKSAA